MKDDKRPSWDVYFMTMAFVIAQRSLDPDTKHGCVVVADDKTILSVGYNSPPRGCDDSKIPLTRPLKYYFMAHSEINAISNAARHGVPLIGSTFYITGFPCEVCFRSIVNVGAKKIVYGPITSLCLKDNKDDIIKLMNTTEPDLGAEGYQSSTLVNIQRFDTFNSSQQIVDLLTSTGDYIFKKSDKEK